MLTSYFQAFFYDENQSYLRRSPKRRSRSFVQAFLKLHYAPIFLYVGPSSVSISTTNVSGAAVSVENTPSGGTGTRYRYAFRATSPGRGGAGLRLSGATAGSSTITLSSATNNGIVVGTGTTAVAPTDYQLATQILDGTTSGTLEHFPCAGTNFTTAGSTASFDMERLFRNSSGGSITVNEVGMYGAYDEFSGFSVSVLAHFCLIRDIVSPGFTINNGEYMRIVYTLSVTA